MANANAPFGLRPVNALGQVYSGRVTQYSVPASDDTAIYVGDLVKIAGTSQFINGNSYSDVIIAASGDVFVGVVVGFVADTRDSTVYRAASTQRIALVCDDPNAVFEAAQGSGGTPLTANDVGLNADISVVAGSTYTGQSASVINNATEATTNTLDLKILQMVNRADNDPGSAVSTGAASSHFLVKINRHQFANQVAGA